MTRLAISLILVFVVTQVTIDQGEKPEKVTSTPPYLLTKVEVFPYSFKTQPSLKELLDKLEQVKKQKHQKRLAELRKLRKQQLEKIRRVLVEKRRAEQKAKQKSLPMPSRGGGSKVDETVARLQELGVSNAAYYVDLALRNGKEYGIEPVWLLAMMKTESNFNPQATSHHNAKGLIQMLPSTGRAMGISDSDQLYNPEVNAQASSKYMAYLLSQFGSLRTATIAYNQGEGNVKRGTAKSWYYYKVLDNYNLIKR